MKRAGDHLGRLVGFNFTSIYEVGVLANASCEDAAMETLGFGSILERRTRMHTGSRKDSRL